MRLISLISYRALGFGLIASVSLFSLHADEAPRHVVFTWQGDTATTLTVNFQTFTAEPIPAVVYWDTVAREGMVEDYRHQSTGTAFRIPNLLDRWCYRIELTGLAPGGTVHLVAGSTNGGISREYKIRTLPADDRPLRFVTGGDMGPSYRTRKLLRESAALSPDVALVGGDIAYANGRLNAVDRWDAWLTYYTEEMITPEGFAIPVILATGNHEVDGGYAQNKDKAPFFFGFFGQDPDVTYFVRNLGANLSFFILDTGHIAAYDGPQATWLDTALNAHAAVPFKAAIYHVPLYPSHRPYDGHGSTAGRAHWAPLFDRHGLTVAFENHDHTYKRTGFLRANARAETGTLYLGDGCWGVNARTTDETERWYLDQTGSVPHFWVVDVDPKGLTYRAIDIRGQVFDVFPTDAPGAAAAATNFAALPRRHPLPRNWVTVTPWQTDDGRSGTSTVTFTNHGDTEVSVTITRDRGPVGATLEVPLSATSLAPGATATFPISFESPAPLEASALANFEVWVTARYGNTTWRDDWVVPVKP